MEKVKDILERIRERSPLGQRLKEGQIWLCWREVVGLQLARNAWPKEIKDKALIVEVKDSAWMQQVSFLKAQIILKLNQRLGEECIEEIHLKLERKRRKKGA